MYYELIYTRCGQGIDLMKKGESIPTEGYKVYACSPELLQDRAIDWSFLVNSAQSKQSYSDPDFMDDAYLYIVPDFGKSFFANFHPRKFEPNQDDINTNRPGNFINQIFVGGFENIYPFELFVNKDIWTAKTKNEAYYYKSQTSGLPVHEKITPTTEEVQRYKERIKEFISDGRKVALASAVSFLTTQYSKEPSQRKFLVISDKSSQNIELWIAAIQCAFSRKLAAKIPFATRMDNFPVANRYTVNPAGLFQNQINYQDPNQKPRYRAMIVGVDERDKTNYETTKSHANSQYVLLDGIAKKPQFDTDISTEYYKMITEFGKEHNAFCEEFLPSVDIYEPNESVVEIGNAYLQLKKAAKEDNTTKMIESLIVLSRYNIGNSIDLKQNEKGMETSKSFLGKITKWVK